jgi:cell wall assembly regulator SMI1
MTDSLNRVENALAELGREKLLGRLRAGRSTDEIRRNLDMVGLKSSESLETLFGWHDGTDTSDAILDDIHMFPGFYLLTLDDALANYGAFVDDPRWQRGWLPLFANGGGDFYVLDSVEVGDGPVRHFRIDEMEHPVEFSSIASFLAVIATCFEGGVFFVDASGYLEMDDQAFAAVAGRVDPTVQWWKG